MSEDKYIKQLFDISMRTKICEDKEALAANYRVGLQEDQLDEMTRFSLYTVYEIY